MSPAENIKAAVVGTAHTGKGILGNISSEKVIATVTSKSQAGAVMFDLTYLGIPLTKAAAKVQDNGTISWAEVK